jgi:hypothetical protein
MSAGSQEVFTLDIELDYIITDHNLPKQHLDTVGGFDERGVSRLT